MNNTFSRRHLSLSLALLAVCACKSEPEPAPPPTEAKVQQAEISNEFTATAKVVAVSAAERTVTLRREDGVQFDVLAGEAVRNFDQIAVGDVLRVRYEEMLAAKVVPGGEVSNSAEAAVAMGRAAEGAAPSAGMGVGVSLRVKIESIDREQGIVTFSLGSGELIAHRIKTPEGHEFVKGLKRGDVVQLDYEESLALSIDKL